MLVQHSPHRLSPFRTVCLQMHDNDLRTSHHQVFRSMLEALGRKDWDAGFALMTEDVLCDWPYKPIPDMPSEMQGRDTIREFFANGQEPFDGLNYQIDRIYELLDPDLLIAEYRSDSRHRDSGIPYRNAYLGILRFRDGKVSYWREYINPQTISELFAALQAH